MSGNKSGGEDLARSLATVMQAALGVGSALARSAAEATAQGSPVAPPAAEAGAVAGIIHYSAATLGNIVALAGAATGPRQPPAPPRAGPVVRPGTGLRVPLSIENPGTEPMRDIRPQLARLEHNGQDVTAMVPDGAVRFVPEQLNVAPRDFEKLTVFMGVPAIAPEGGYRATIALGAGFGEVAIDFTVRTPAAG
jgi:hypothetical protein